MKKLMYLLITLSISVCAMGSSAPDGVPPPGSDIIFDDFNTGNAMVFFDNENPYTTDNLNSTATLTIDTGTIITGTITDSRTGEKVAGASISIKGISGNVFSDADGNYTIRVPEGAAMLVATGENFEVQSKSINGRDRINFGLDQF